MKQVAEVALLLQQHKHSISLKYTDIHKKVMITIYKCSNKNKIENS